MYLVYNVSWRSFSPSVEPVLYALIIEKLSQHSYVMRTLKPFLTRLYSHFNCSMPSMAASHELASIRDSSSMNNSHTV